MRYSFISRLEYNARVGVHFFPPCLRISDTSNPSALQNSHRNICVCSVSRGPVDGVQRGDANELKNIFCLSRKLTLWSNISNLASFRASVIQTELNVFVADVIDSGMGERGALVLAAAVFDLAPTAASLSVLGFVSCLSDVDLLTDALR